MGLDMYLKASHYVSGYSFSDEDSVSTYRKILGAVHAEDIADPETPSLEVSVTVAYWRKANAIHRWFVENVQDGNDDCREYDVSREQLGELRELCLRVLAAAKTEDGKVSNGYSFTKEGGREDHYADGRVITNPTVAEEVLPTQEGFFFGSTDYDEFYLRDLESTVTQIDRVLKTPDDWWFTYRSSW